MADESGNLCEVCETQAAGDYFICGACIGDRQYVGDVTIKDTAGGAQLLPDGSIRYLDGAFPDVDVSIKVKGTSEKPAYRLRRTIETYHRRRQREVITYLYDRVHQIFRKRYVNEATGQVEYNDGGRLEDQTRHGKSGKRKP